MTVPPSNTYWLERLPQIPRPRPIRPLPRRPEPPLTSRVLQYLLSGGAPPGALAELLQESDGAA
jgi:hypothetical protein